MEILISMISNFHNYITVLRAHFPFNSRNLYSSLEYLILHPECYWHQANKLMVDWIITPPWVSKHLHCLLFHNNKLLFLPSTPWLHIPCSEMETILSAQFLGTHSNPTVTRLEYYRLMTLSTIYLPINIWKVKVWFLILYQLHFSCIRNNANWKVSPLFLKNIFPALHSNHLCFHMHFYSLPTIFLIFQIFLALLLMSLFFSSHFCHLFSLSKHFNMLMMYWYPLSNQLFLSRLGREFYHAAITINSSTFFFTEREKY